MKLTMLIQIFLLYFALIAAGFDENILDNLDERLELIPPGKNYFG